MVNVSENRMSREPAGQAVQPSGCGRPPLPSSGKLVLVQCQSFRCLGFYDAAGKWRNARTVQELDNVRAWCGIEDDTFIPVS
jgi:hypothetical protein